NAKAYGDKIIIKLSESDNKININIEDNGPGISKKDYQKALKPFQRLDSSRNQNIAGSGLGLSISQDIIKTLDGDLSLSKSEIGGLKVEINLPKIS
ncbi:MAG: ATP-binding protein, partial [Pseudomonadota bacterium]|nr:ATP-binding protein [Pseudomonadota bacterium]